MSYKILVPLDGSELAEEVVPYVHSLALQPQADVTLLHVLPDLVGRPVHEVAEARDRALELMGSFRPHLELPDATVDCQLRMGEPAAEILKAATLLPSSLIVMPTHGRKGLDRLLNGSVTETVLRRCRCPMLLSHQAGHEPGSQTLDQLFRRILVPLDGSDASGMVVPMVQDFAHRYESEVILFHDTRGISDTGDAAEDVKVVERIEAYRDELQRAGIRVSMQASNSGHPAQEILRLMSESEVDLVAMTTHGRSGLDRVVYGSVAEYVLRNGSRPMLVFSVASPGGGAYEEAYLG